ncbi:hypothetical protein B1J97_17600 [Aeromonas veronii]|nr:hypothetical protein [Aeromonas veronii]
MWAPHRSCSGLQPDFSCKRAGLMGSIRRAIPPVMPAMYTAFTEAHKEIPWRSMRNMRNRMAHGYFDINLDIVWDTVQELLPELLKQLPVVLQHSDQARDESC